MNPPTVLSVFPPKCYRCDFTNYNTKGEYDYHCVTRHPTLPAYPGPADIRESWFNTARNALGDLTCCEGALVSQHTIRHFLR